MKFSEMPYNRPDIDEFKKVTKDFTSALSAAEDYEQAKSVFLKKQKSDRRIQTLATIAHIRHSIDTRDEFYDGEEQFWNNALPEIQEVAQL